MQLFVTGTDTDCGKTIVSAILCEALKAAYWKPVQTGSANRDANTVEQLVSYSISIFPETYLLKEPASPHHAAALEGKEVSLSAFVLPELDNHLVVEGAGGVLVPLNESGDFVIDIAQRFALEVVLVIRLRLGCINHTLLSIRELTRRNVPIKGLVFNGQDSFGAISVITELSKLPVLLHIEQEETITPEVVKKYASRVHL